VAKSIGRNPSFKVYVAFLARADLGPPALSGSDDSTLRIYYRCFDVIPPSNRYRGEKPADSALSREISLWIVPNYETICDAVASPLFFLSTVARLGQKFASISRFTARRAVN
jgi:hypothetical protein